MYDHVLTRFDENQRAMLEGGTFGEACEAVRGVLTNGMDKTMTAVNNKK